MKRQFSSAALLLVMLLGLSIGAQAGEAPALELILFTKPDCPECQKIVKLLPEMEAASPKLKITLQPNRGAADVAEARSLQASGNKIEAWAAGIAVFVGPGWDSAEGQAVAKKLHGLLEDRLGIWPEDWPPKQGERSAWPEMTEHPILGLGGLLVGCLLVVGWRFGPRWRKFHD